MCFQRSQMALSEDPVAALNLLKKFHQKINNDQCIEYDYGTRLNDVEAVELIQKIIRVESPKQIQAFEIGKRNEALRELKKRNLSIRQIERLTGISFGVIRNL